jgi:hypothetical protein
MNVAFLALGFGAHSGRASPDRVVVVAFSARCVLFAGAQLVRHCRRLLPTARDGLVRPFDEPEEADRVAK